MIDLLASTAGSLVAVGGTLAGLLLSQNGQDRRHHRAELLAAFQAAHAALERYRRTMVTHAALRTAQRMTAQGMSPDRVGAELDRHDLRVDTTTPDPGALAAARAATHAARDDLAAPQALLAMTAGPAVRDALEQAVQACKDLRETTDPARIQELRRTAKTRSHALLDHGHHTTRPRPLPWKRNR